MFCLLLAVTVMDVTDIYHKSKRTLKTHFMKNKKETLIKDIVCKVIWTS